MLWNCSKNSIVFTGTSGDHSFIVTSNCSLYRTLSNHQRFRFRAIRPIIRRVIHVTIWSGLATSDRNSLNEQNKYTKVPIKIWLVGERLQAEQYLYITYANTYLEYLALGKQISHVKVNILTFLDSKVEIIYGLDSSDTTC